MLTSRSPGRRAVLTTILTAGVAGGAFDIAYACVAYGASGVHPLQVIQSVASGLLGRSAYRGGIATVGLGLFLHIVLACLMAAGFCLAWRRSARVRSFPLVAGGLYGVAMYVLMTFIVAPLSRAWPTPPFPHAMTIPDVIAHVLFVGVLFGWIVDGGLDRHRPD